MENSANAATPEHGEYVDVNPTSTGLFTGGIDDGQTILSEFVERVEKSIYGIRWLEDCYGSGKKSGYEIAFANASGHWSVEMRFDNFNGRHINISHFYAFGKRDLSTARKSFAYPVQIIQEHGLGCLDILNRNRQKWYAANKEEIENRRSYNSPLAQARRDWNDALLKRKEA